MGMVGKEIIQTRLWVDPKAPKPPDLNFKNVYPVTVYEAVKESMNDTAPNLKDLLDSIHKDLASKQPIFSGKPSNYIMTFAGVAGGIGSIAISREVPLDVVEQRHDKIPTEKAVGDLLSKLGLLNEEGNIDPDAGKKIKWYDIIGRPNTYYDLGLNEDGFVIQKTITTEINSINDNIKLIIDNGLITSNNIYKLITSHQDNKNNPHNVTVSQLNAVSNDSFKFHVENLNNPHNVDKIQVGLGEVDNTSDSNKPISKDTLIAINNITSVIDDINIDLDKFILNASYDLPSGQLILTLKDNSQLILSIPINGLVDEVSYNIDTKELLLMELGGKINKVDLSDLYIRYNGSITNNITIDILEGIDDRHKTITAIINKESITSYEMSTNSILTNHITNNSVTTDKIINSAITSDKLDVNIISNKHIVDETITNVKIANNTITGNKITSSIADNRVFGIITHGDSPSWMQINTNMIEDFSITNIKIALDAIGTNNIINKSITNDKLDDLSITNIKIINNTISNDKLLNNTITGNKIIPDIILPGTPKVNIRPTIDANNNQIPDTFWVNDKLDNIQIDTDNIIDRTVTGDKLFTSSSANTVLTVIDANSNPIWGLINFNMMENDSIGTNNIIDANITDIKIADNAIKTNHIDNSAITSNHIKNGEIASNNIWKSDKANMVLASLIDNSHPVYTKIIRKMLVDNIISNNQIEDRTITLQKLTTTNVSNRIMGVVIGNTTPVWLQLTNEMITERAINGRTLFSSPESNRVLAVQTRTDDASWVQITNEMIKSKTIIEDNISDDAISSRVLKDSIIESKHILDRSIQSVDIASRAITGAELFTSPEPNKVLALTSAPYANPEWLSITSDMIENDAITREKIFKSTNPYRVLGATEGNVSPEYVRITSDFIVDDSIIPQKLVHDFVLFGKPEITGRPSEDADNRQIPDTYWVRKVVASMIKDFNPKILFDLITTEMVQDRAIDGTKLFSHKHAPRVLGITHPHDDPEYILIEEELIVDGAVTVNKLQRDITLLGSPMVETRPFAEASDARGGGRLIPDCQWVLDAIGGGGSGSGGSGGNINRFDPEYFVETIAGISLNITNILATRSEIDEIFNNIGPGTPGTGGGSGGGGNLGYESVITDYIANRAVTGDKLFSSNISDRLLAVKNAYSSPIYTQATTDMIQDRAITSTKLFSSTSANKALITVNAGSDSIWGLINNNMMDRNSVGAYQLITKSITNIKLADGIIDGRTLFSSNTDNRILGVTTANSTPRWMQIISDMISDNAVNTIHLKKDSVTTDKILQNAITTSKLENGPIITSIHLQDNCVINSKYANKSITTNKIADGVITSTLLEDSMVLPGHPTVNPHTSYSTRSLRNTIISPAAPTGGENGDIWLRYI